MLEMEKRRPVDVLAAVLEERVPARLESFFRTYDPAEAAAMAVQLATSPPTVISTVRACGSRQWLPYGAWLEMLCGTTSRPQGPIKCKYAVWVRASPTS